jgi:hypothetical protein
MALQNKPWLKLFFCTLAITFICLIFSILQKLAWAQCDVTFVNGTNEPISVLRMNICGQGFKAEKIKAGSKVKFVFEARNDSGYNIEIIFNSKRRIGQTIGYVTSGMRYHDVLLVRTEQVVFGSRSCN